MLSIPDADAPFAAFIVIFRGEKPFTIGGEHAMTVEMTPRGRLQAARLPPLLTIEDHGEITGPARKSHGDRLKGMRGGGVAARREIKAEGFRAIFAQRQQGVSLIPGFGGSEPARARRGPGGGKRRRKRQPAHPGEGGATAQGGFHRSVPVAGVEPGGEAERRAEAGFAVLIKRVDPAARRFDAKPRSRLAHRLIQRVRRLTHHIKRIFK